jgi:pimeloyl-ACP methyl ester carboxylesterase
MEQSTQEPSTAPAPTATVRRRRKWLRRAAWLFVLLLTGWLGSSMLVTWKLTRRMRPIAEPPPTVAGLQILSDRIRTSDGEVLGAWFSPGDPSKPTVLLVHGYTSARGEWSTVLPALARQGYGVLAITLRGHGDSTGGSLDVGYSSQHDVVAGVAYLESHCPGRPVVVCGSSLGAAASIFASAELGRRVRAYVLDAPYKDLQTAVFNRLENALPWPFAHVAYPGMLLWAPVFMKTPMLDIAPIRHVSDIPEDVPVVFLSGGADRNARPEEADALFDRVRSHARLLRFPGIGHSDLLHHHPDEFLRVLTQAIHDAVPPLPLLPTTPPLAP